MQKKNKKSELEKDHNRSLGWYNFFRGLLSPIYKFWYNPKIINGKVIPKDGPIIVCGNHKHVMDQCAPIVCTKRVLHYMAKKEYFDGKYAWFFRKSGCISVNRQIKDEKAKNEALKVLKDGGAIGIFPEGTRNKTKNFLLPFKYGAVSMAKKTGATIVPFGVTGDYKFRSKSLTYRFGKPFKIDDLSLEEANKKLELVIGNLMKENLIDNRKGIKNEI